MRLISKTILYSIIIAVLSVVLIVIIKEQKGEDNSKKDSNIPANAVWKGGLDGGWWFELISFNKIEKKCRIRIYHEYNGNVEIDDNFILDNCNNVEIDSDILNHINFYANEEIVLDSGCKLKLEKN